MLERETAVSGGRTVDPTIALADESGERPDDDALISTLCRAVLDGGDDGDDGDGDGNGNRYSLAEARAAVDVAVSRVGSNAGLAALIRAAFEALHPNATRAFTVSRSSSRVISCVS